jgi:hypothetical protein
MLMMMPLCTHTNISEELIASDFMVILGYPDNLGSKPLWNILTHTYPHQVIYMEKELPSFDRLP